MSENNTDNKCQAENTEPQNHRQKLITEFTPSTGLRFRAPLQWEPIQLISQNGTTGSGLITETGHQQ